MDRQTVEAFNAAINRANEEVAMLVGEPDLAANVYAITAMALGLRLIAEVIFAIDNEHLADAIKACGAELGGISTNLGFIAANR